MQTQVAIAGAGIGGLAAALALARAGFQVEVLEQAQALLEVGAGLQLSPNAMRALRSLGLEADVERVASEPYALELRLGRSGQRVFSIPVEAAARSKYGAPYLHIHRADLLRVLADAAKQAGVRILLDGRVSGFADDRTSGVEGVRIGLANGRILHADLLIGADGARSTVRKQLFGDGAPRFTGCVAWRGVIPQEKAGAVLPEQKAVVWAGPGRHAVTYPLRGGALLNFVGVVEATGWEREDWNEPGDPAELAAAFAGWAAPVTAAICAMETCHRWALFDRDPMAQWSRGPVTLLGDACHPMPPFQAQGAAMALEDAVILARCLLAEPGPAGLAIYETKRRDRTARILASARGNMHTFHRRSTLSRIATYAPMRIADLLLPGYVHSRQDWIYGYDPEKA